MDYHNSSFLSIPWAVAGLAVAYGIYTTYKLKSCCKNSQVNPSIQKDNDKVVHSFDIEDLTDKKTAFCRCWRSKKFPYCDGAHNAYNKCTGDNTGPLVIKKRDE